MNSITVFILRVLPTPWQTFPKTHDLSFIKNNEQ